MLTRWAGWFFRDRASGRIVIGQFPNLSLWLFGGAWILSRIASGDVAHWALIASRLCLVMWRQTSYGVGSIRGADVSGWACLPGWG